MNEITMKVGLMVELPAGIDRLSWMFGFELGIRAANKPKADGGVVIGPCHGLNDTDFLTIDNHDDDGCPGVHVVHYANAFEVPLEDVPCPCGDSKCWAIKWVTR